MHVTLRRAVVGATTLAVAAGCGVVTMAPATAATPGQSNATAQSLQVSLGGQSAYASDVAQAHNTGSGPTVKNSTNTTPSQPLPGVGVGVLAATAVANPDGTSYACAGLVAPGGQISVGSDSSQCTITGPRRGGVTVNLGGSLAPVPGVGFILLKMNAISAHAAMEGRTRTGTVRIDGALLEICAGRSSGTRCGGQVVDVPLTIRGTRGEDVTPALLDSLTHTSQLGALGATLSAALRPVLSITTNIRGTNSANAFQITAISIKIGGGSAADFELATATAGPNRSR